MKAVLMSLMMTVWIASLEAGTTGKVAGRVKDATTGEGLVGANVVLEGTTLGAATDSEGYYVILNVPPGKYNVIISSIGYRKKIVSGIQVNIDLTTTVNIDLDPTVLEMEEITVTAHMPPVRKDLTSSEARVTASEIRNLPVQEVHEVISLQAGVTVDRGGGIHIRGGRTSEVAYWVDGISVSDVYDGGQAVQVDNNAMQELQVISGTFNAEYGQAMSGIVNIVTKDGGEKLRGFLTYYSGDYVTSDSHLFTNLGKASLTDNLNLEGSLSGPVPFLPQLTFYTSGRYYKSDGWLYGIRRFNPDGTTGDSAFVPMNGRTRFSGQAKLSYNITPTMKLSLTAIHSNIEFRDYNHDWKYNPDGDVKKFDLGNNVSLIFTHTISSSAFYTINVSSFYKRFKEYLYANPFDPRYVLDPQAMNRDLYEFIKRGTNNHRFRRTTTTRVAKFDYTDQLNRLHQLKFGLEGRLHELFFDDYSLVPRQLPDGRYAAEIPDLTTPLHEQYRHKPVEFSAYIQDKLEYEQMIVNVGIRFDYFDSRGEIPADLQDPNVYLPQKPENQTLTFEQRLAKWYKKASAKKSFSPRFGISYPITDRGVLHFSYGHFLQIPSFIHLYQKPGYKVTTASGLQGVYGNADLNPQKTVMYEFGLQQQLTEAMSFDVTGFYRDTRDWVSTSTRIPVRDPETATSYYTMFINRDYANSRGITLTLNKRPANVSDFLTFNLSYTFQVAEGNNSNPDEEQAAQQSNREPTRVLTPLDWDQTHTMNVSVGLNANDWSFYLLGRYGSGLPYSPVLNQAEGRGEDAARVLTKNSRRRPATYTVDLNGSKRFTLGPVNMVAFVKVFNLFDRRNEVEVFGQTGRATASERALGAQPVNQNPGRINTVEEFIRRPDFYSEPREIQVGLEISF
jgi:outer membrane receptor for ferrienterochelin and colicin